MAETVTVRGEGGWTFDMDVPSDPAARELFEDAVAKGRLVVVSDGSADGDPPPAEPSGVPDGTVDAVVSWVRGGLEDGIPAEGWEQRAAQALAAEQAKGDDARSSLVKLLSPLVNPPGPED